jgi:hypothetical protein
MAGVLCGWCAVLWWLETSATPDLSKLGMSTKLTVYFCNSHWMGLLEPREKVFVPHSQNILDKVKEMTKRVCRTKNAEVEYKWCGGCEKRARDLGPLIPEYRPEFVGHIPLGEESQCDRGYVSFTDYEYS